MPTQQHRSQTNPLPNQANNTLQHQIPWWQELDPTVRAQLELATNIPLSEQHPDVIVIGGGIAGLSAALSARAVGAQVMVLEEQPMLGYGATGRNAGILSAGINMGLADLPPDSPAAAFWPETTRLLLSLVHEATQPSTLLSAHLTGALTLAKSAYAARKLAREARARVAAGLRAEIWSAQEVARATEGRLNTQSLVSALWLPDEGRIHPLTLLAHLAQQARQQEIILVGQAQVCAYQKVQSTSTTAHWRFALSNGRTIEAGALIQAVGPTVQPNARIYALAFAADLPANFPLFWDASPYTYTDFRPGNGRLTVSGGRYGKAGKTQRDAIYHQQLANAARHWLPELAQQEPTHTWAVNLHVAADLIPNLRTLGSNAPGLAIEGLGALGVLPGIVLGRRAGHMMASEVL